MAPKSAAALFLLAAMIAGLAPPLQAQPDPRAVSSFLSQVHNVCSGDDAMQSCAVKLVTSGDATVPPDCCRALLMKAVTSGEGTRCACRFGNMAAALGVDVDQSCQAASNGVVAGGPSKLKELCTRVPGNNMAAALGVDVDQSCQAASNGVVAGGPSKLKELCTRVPGNN